MVTTRSGTYGAPRVDKSAGVSKPSTARLQKEVDQLKTKLADTPNTRILKDQIEDLTNRLREKEEVLQDIQANQQDAFRAVGVEQERLNRSIHMRDETIKMTYNAMLKVKRHCKAREAELMDEIDALKVQILRLNDLVQSGGASTWKYTAPLTEFDAYLESDGVSAVFDAEVEAWYEKDVDDGLDAFIENMTAKFTIPWMNESR